MAIKFERVKVGDILYERHRTKMGNTKMSQLGEWPVEIREIDVDRRAALAAWNYNPAKWMPARKIERMFRTSMYDKYEKKP